MAALTRRLIGAVALAIGAIPLMAPATPARTLAAPGHRQLGAPRELVVLVHGMGRSSFSMRPLARALEAEGYDVMNFGYSSFCCTIPELAARLRADLDARIVPEHRAVHFVGHSLGNIIVRWALTHDPLPAHIGRVVMLAPPNQGARAADRFAPLVGWLVKPIIGLRADSVGVVRALPRVQGVQIGVIAARGDHTVKLPETHLAEESGHIVVDGGHSFIMLRDDVKRQMLAFLRTGAFATDGSGPGQP